MINLDDNNQPVSPEIGKIRIKDFSDMSYTADDDKDFHIRTVRDETLIEHVRPRQCLRPARQRPQPELSNRWH